MGECERAWCIIGWDWRKGRNWMVRLAEAGLHVLTKYPKAHRSSRRYCVCWIWDRISICPVCLSVTIVSIVSSFWGPKGYGCKNDILS